MDIQTPRLALRPVEPGDADWIAREIANPNVHRWLGGPPRPFHVSDAETWISQVAADPMVRLITMNTRPLGIVGVTLREDGANLGYWLAESAWGRGYMTEAAYALCTLYFDSTGDPLYSGWLDGNAASRNVLSKLGFAPLGPRQVFSKFYGHDVTDNRVWLASAQGLQAPAPRVTSA